MSYAYKGYRLRIDSVKFPEGMIARGTYSVTPRIPRVLKEFHDATGRKHVITSKRKTATISFDIRKRRAEQQQEIMEFFAEKEKCEVIYWDDMSGVYQQGTFRIKEMTFQHNNKRGGLLIYEPTHVELEEL